jgi:hypothetical protein
LPDLASIIKKSELTNRNTIEFLSELKINKKVNILENEGGLSYFLKNNFNWIKIDSIKNSFNHFLEKKNVGIIIASEKLNLSPVLRNNSEWYNFLIYPEHAGFRKIKIR